MPLHVVTLNPMSSRWTRRILHGFPTSKVGIHSKYAERIRRYKYRQGYRPTGKHLRVKLSIPKAWLEAKL